jgi:hypothetical protein
VKKDCWPLLRVVAHLLVFSTKRITYAHEFLFFTLSDCEDVNPGPDLILTLIAPDPSLWVIITLWSAIAILRVCRCDGERTVGGGGSLLQLGCGAEIHLGRTFP